METLADLLFKTIVSEDKKTAKQVEYINSRLFVQGQRTSGDTKCLEMSKAVDMFSAIIDTERGLFKKRFPDEVDSFHSCDDTLLLMNSSKDTELGNKTPEKSNTYELTGKARKKLLIDWDATKESDDENQMMSN